MADWGSGDPRRNYFVTAPQTSGYEAGVYESVQCDPTEAGFTVDLPASPLLGDVVRIKNIGTSTNVITIDGDTIDVEEPDSLGTYASTATLSGAGASVTYEYNGSKWTIVNLVGV